MFLEKFFTIRRHYPLAGCWAAKGAMWKGGALPAVTGLTDLMDYVILVTFKKEQG